MLPSDVTARKKATAQVQNTIDSHLTERTIADRVTAYSDKAFTKAAVEWLISTDQVRLSSPLYCHVMWFGLLNLAVLLSAAICF
jgi:hypothetical protein